MNLEDSITGCILGTAVGDALGLAAEGIDRDRLARMYPDYAGYHFLFGRGMISDDTEHTIMTAQAMTSAGDDVDKFIHDFARGLRLWLLAFPAGIGKATLKACARLMLGYSGHESGVYSAGNGPAMRSAIIGVCHGANREKMRNFVRASTRVTHVDPKAEYGALAVALAAHMGQGSDVSPTDYHRELTGMLRNESDAAEFLRLMDGAVKSVESGETALVFADACGMTRGVSGYIYHTVPVVIHCWLRHQRDYRAGVLEIIRLGGDTDTTAAILGGIIGARVGEAGIPHELIDKLAEWPATVNWMRRVALTLAESVEKNAPRVPPSIFFPLVCARNFLFFGVVLAHIVKRIFQR